MKQDMISFPAQVSIGRVYGDDDETCIRIQIHDEGTHVEVCELHLSLESFARTLVGGEYVHCNGSYCPNAPVNQVCELKESIIPDFPGYVPDFAVNEEAGNWIRDNRPSELEGGWFVFGVKRRYIDGKGTLYVTLRRYVPREEKTGNV